MQPLTTHPKEGSFPYSRTKVKHSLPTLPRAIAHRILLPFLDYKTIQNIASLNRRCHKLVRAPITRLPQNLIRYLFELFSNQDLCTFARLSPQCCRLAYSEHRLDTQPLFRLLQQPPKLVPEQETKECGSHFALLNSDPLEMAVFGNTAFRTDTEATTLMTVDRSTGKEKQRWKLGKKIQACIPISETELIVASDDGFINRWRLTQQDIELVHSAWIFQKNAGAITPKHMRVCRRMENFLFLNENYNSFSAFNFESFIPPQQLLQKENDKDVLLFTSNSNQTFISNNCTTNALEVVNGKISITWSRKWKLGNNSPGKVLIGGFKANNRWLAIKHSCKRYRKMTKNDIGDQKAALHIVCARTGTSILFHAGLDRSYSLTFHKNLAIAIAIDTFYIWHVPTRDFIYVAPLFNQHPSFQLQPYQFCTNFSLRIKILPSKVFAQIFPKDTAGHYWKPIPSEMFLKFEPSPEADRKKGKQSQFVGNSWLSCFHKYFKHRQPGRA